MPQLLGHVRLELPLRVQVGKEESLIPGTHSVREVNRDRVGRIDGRRERNAQVTQERLGVLHEDL